MAKFQTGGAYTGGAYKKKACKFVMAGEIAEKYLIFKIYRDQKYSCDS